MTTNPEKTIGQVNSLSSDMEDPLMVIRDLAYALQFMSNGMTLEAARAVNRLGVLINDYAEEVEDLRAQIWHQTHPNDEPARRVPRMDHEEVTL